MRPSRTPDQEPPVIEMPGDDAEWVRRAKGGDRWAEEALYRAHVTKVTRAVTRLLGRVAEADDVVQDTFVRAIENLPKLEDDAQFGAWVRRIAISLCMRRFRRRRLLRALGLDRGTDDASFDALALPALAADRRLELAMLDRALLRVKPLARSAWILHRVEGWTLEESASSLDVSLATLKRRLTEADAAIERAVRMSSEEVP
jgi:RNA polymerase sigma-70 factor (ECF subfamily)